MNAKIEKYVAIWDTPDGTSFRVGQFEELVKACEEEAAEYPERTEINEDCAPDGWTLEFESGHGTIRFVVQAYNEGWNQV